MLHQCKCIVCVVEVAGLVVLLVKWAGSVWFSSGSGDRFGGSVQAWWFSSGLGDGFGSVYAQDWFSSGSVQAQLRLRRPVWFSGGSG